MLDEAIASHAADDARNSKVDSHFLASPADCDADRDYDEGQLSYGSAPPEGQVYLPEVLGEL